MTTSAVTTPWPRASRLRRTLAVGAALATTPYLVLKALWLSGSRIGLHDPTFGTDAVMHAANAVTAGMAAVAAVLAVTFVASWGHRVPALLVLVPMYVGSGLLGGILVVVPVQLVVAVLSAHPTSATASSAPIAGWVYAMVYGGFSALGVCLLWLFTLYARDRWVRPGGWLRHLADLPLAPAHRTAGWTVAAGCSLVAAGQLLAELADPEPDRAYTGGNVALTLLAAAGVAALTSRRPRRCPAWLVLTAVWLGGASMAAWGLYLTVLMAVPNDLFPADQITWQALSVQVARVLVGLATVVVLRPARHGLAVGQGVAVSS